MNTYKDEIKTIDNILAGNQETIFSFYMENKKKLIVFLCRNLETEDAEEVLQDSFVAFFEALRSFRGNCSLKTFLYSIAKRKMIDLIRKKKIKKILFSALPSRVVESVSAVFFDDEMDKRFIRERMESILNQLPHDYAVILRLKYWKGYKVFAIAKKLRISFKSAESILFRARKAFIKLYQET
jgi:RNA polymerase sigma-70 factor, ECF subfamily